MESMEVRKCGKLVSPGDGPLDYSPSRACRHRGRLSCRRRPAGACPGQCAGRSTAPSWYR
eukprot:300891-Chlamydomonas_euryale.AAC.9